MDLQIADKTALVTGSHTLAGTATTGGATGVDGGVVRAITQGGWRDR